MRIKNLFIVLFSVFSLFSLFGVKSANAQTDLPERISIPPAVVKCLEEEFENPEFHSLRPYQASPCGDTPVVYFCNNDYIIEEDVSRQWSTDTSECDPDTFVCGANSEADDFIIDEEDGGRQYMITVHEAEFPIMGNTQNVINSQQPNEDFDGGQKMSEYVNWYLQGVTDKAEYGNDVPDSISTYAGPAKKMVPFDFLNFNRLKVLHDAGVKPEQGVDCTEVECPPGEVTIDPNTGEATGRFTLNHPHIAVCTDGGEPVPCYNGSGNWNWANGKATGSKRRLITWWESRGSTPSQTFFNWTDFNVWGGTTPPFPWQFDDALLYQKAYNEWRGKTCVIIPLVRQLSCIDFPGPGELVRMYRFVPLGNANDKNKKHVIGGIGARAPGQTKAEVLFYEIIKEPVFHYPHTESTIQVSKMLNFTHTPIKCDEEGNCGLIKGFGDNFEMTSCEFLDVRVNPGDDLTFTDPPSFMLVDPVMTEVTQIECTNSGTIDTFVNECGNQTHSVCETVAGCSRVECGFTCGTLPAMCTSVPECEAVVYIEIRTTPKIPGADDIWKNTVVGRTSPFRRIFPKLEQGAPVTCIAEIPGVSDITYTTNDETNLIRIQGPGTIYPHRYAGAGAEATSVGEIFFPHQGTILEYFLHGIQTALRPQGYGSPISNGDLCEETEVLSCGDIDVPDSMVPAKYLGEYKTNFIRMADEWPWKCKGPENNLAEECYNYVVSTAQAEGVNPAFALAIWLNESGASNYCFGGPTTQDFGINLSAIYMNVVKQLEIFIKMAKERLCEGQGPWVENMHGWLSRFQSSSGTCNPADETATAYYYNIMNGAWTFLAGECKTTDVDGTELFGLEWPTDMSCP